MKNIRNKIFTASVLTVSLALTLVSCMRETVLPTSISLDAPSLLLNVGQSKKITADVKPLDATDKSVVWTSTNLTVASVSSDGLVSAIAPGSASIFACTSCGGFTATCQVTVTDPVSGISLDKKEITLYEHEFVDLKATVNTLDESKKKVIWSSMADSLVTVHEGRVTAIRAPMDEKPVKVIVMTEDKSANDICEVTVKCHVSSVSLRRDSLSLIPGQSFDLEPKILPERASDRTYTITSSNPSVVSVDENGTVTALAVSDDPVAITLKSNDEIADNLSYTATCMVSVVRAVKRPTGIIMLKNGEEVSSFDMFRGESDSKVTLVAQILPDDVTDKGVRWNSTYPDVASVEIGTEPSIAIISALKNGSTDIQATAEDGGLVATCRVNVYTPLRSVAIKPVAEMYEGDMRELQLELNPEDASVSSVEWQVSDASVAKISGNSLYACKSNGKDVKVSVKVNGVPSALEASTMVSVKCHVSGIRINKNTLALEEGDVFDGLTATVYPENATDKSYKWTSDNTSVVKVDENSGKVTAVKSSEDPVYIRAITTDGSIKDSCEVTVFKTLKGLDIWCDERKVDSPLSLAPGGTKTLVAKLDPADASNPVVRWKIGNDKVATINDKGELKAVANGVTSVFAISDNGLSAQCEVIVSTAVSSIKFDSSTLVQEMYEGDKPVKLSVIFNPETASDKSLTWTSSDENVLYVSGDGSLMPRTAKSGGSKVTITARSSNNKTCTCTVTVKCHVSDISMSESTCTLEPEQTVQLRASVFPRNATNQAVTWSSSKPSLASVDKNGLVTALAKGTVEITATSVDNPNIRCKCTVTVVNPEPKIVPVTGVDISAASLNLVLGETGTLSATVKPTNATNKTVSWTTDNSSVATVIDGKVTAKAVGTATITVTTQDGGFSKTCKVTVIRPEISSLSISPASVSDLEVGSSKQLSVTVSPSTASTSGLVWSSNDKAVASVTSSGKVTANKPGTTTITVTSPNGKSATCKVTVVTSVVHVTKVHLSPTMLNLYPGQDAVLTVTVEPENATNKEVRWEVSGGGVNCSEGRLTATKAGSSDVFVTVISVDNPSCKHTCIVNTIAAKAVGLSLSKSAMTLQKGDSAKLETVFNPVNTTDKSVVWASDNTGVVTVTDGIVKAVGEGTATVSATSSDGGYMAVCKVTVTAGAIDDNTNQNVDFETLN